MMMNGFEPILPNIDSSEDIRALNDDKLESLAMEIRRYLIQSVSKCGGHLASNLGIVEITLALHRVFHCPADKIIFDVGHQAYVHKVITGRREAMAGLRRKDGLSGFPKREESVYDAFNTGHASTSISAALGMLRAMRLEGDEGSRVVAVIGDGALSGGMAFEALNDAGQSELPLIIVLNDNDMSIAGNVGAVHGLLNDMRSSRRYLSFKHSVGRALERIPKIGRALSARTENLKNRIKYFLLPNVLFEELGFTYLGPINGHDIRTLTEAFIKAREMNQPVILHTVTEKGRGYGPAEQNPEKFHGIGQFNARTGMESGNNGLSNSAFFGLRLAELAQENPKIAAITAAMPLGTGLVPFKEAYPDRFFDVAIAEQHAVTMAAGMACAGMRPVVAVYSTFLQRAYDQILHDVCLQNLPVVFAVDRAGLVGEDGETHQGVFDISFMMHMPNMKLYSPASQDELKQMLELALNRNEPAAIRYNRGALPGALSGAPPVAFGKWDFVKPLGGICVIATGRMVQAAIAATEELSVGLINARFLKPMDEGAIALIRDNAKAVITIEDGAVEGGFGMRLASRLSGTAIKVELIGVPDRIIGHASVRQQDAICNMDIAGIRRRILELMEEI